MSGLATLLEKEGLREGLVQLNREAFPEQDDLRLFARITRFLADHRGVHGWLTMQSHVLIVRNGRLYRPKAPSQPYGEEHWTALPKYGLAVNGELGCPAASLQWHWHGDGWHLVTLKEGSGMPCWIEEVTHLGDQRENQPTTQCNLTYHRYWRRDEGIRPFAARLITLTGGK